MSPDDSGTRVGLVPIRVLHPGVLAATSGSGSDFRTLLAVHALGAALLSFLAVDGTQAKHPGTLFRVVRLAQRRFSRELGDNLDCAAGETWKPQLIGVSIATEEMRLFEAIHVLADRAPSARRHLQRLAELALSRLAIHGEVPHDREAFFVS